MYLCTIKTNGAPFGRSPTSIHRHTMKHSSPLLLSLLFVAAVSPLHAQVAQTAAPREQADTLTDQATTAPKQVDLRSATVSAKRKGLFHALGLTQNNETITGHELLRAACCNLGESFVNNPSVDVNYSDAATGARQIKLLGLAGTYVQMLAENVPTMRNLAQPFGLNYVPGTWMESIQVSKGASSVKNGYESLTGQINVEYKKPQVKYPNILLLNGYADAHGRIEGNVESTLLPSARWGTTVLGHYSQTLHTHDENHDGLADRPKTEQFNLMNRWTYNGDHLLSQFYLRGLKETREGGQFAHHGEAMNDPYRVTIDTKRVEATNKTAWMFHDENNTNIALILSGSRHLQNANYDHRIFNARQTNAYASLLFETQWQRTHTLSAGLSLNHDDFGRTVGDRTFAPGVALPTSARETVAGAYAQYTYTLGSALTLMGGVRIDHSNLYGTFVTPRAHLKFSPRRNFVVRLNAGKGYRTAWVPEEMNYLLTGSRTLDFSSDHLREEAWNYGLNIGYKLPLGDHVLDLSADYYYTNFEKQAVVDFDADPHRISIHPLQGDSYSHVVQLQASYPLFEGFNLTAAYRYTNVRTAFGRPDGSVSVMEKPLQSRYKALVTATYATPLEKWQFDVTLQLNGGGRLPLNYVLADGTTSWNPYFKAYPQLSAQVTRNFRGFSVYVGGENLTGYKQPNAVIDFAHPRGSQFDPTLVYGPLDGAMFYAGFRYTIAR